jgi:hypothetical protein
MIVYSVMEYDYEDTDIRMVTENFELALEYEPCGLLSIWENGIKITVYRQKNTGKWLPWSKINEEQSKVYNKFLEVNNLK